MTMPDTDPTRAETTDAAPTESTTAEASTTDAPLTESAPPEALADPATMASSSPLTPAIGVTTTQTRDSRGDRTGLAILLMCMTSALFAVQDAISRHMGSNYSPFFVTMIRYWFFAAFVVFLAVRSPGGLRRATRSAHPWLQTARGILLVAQVIVMILAFVNLGLVGTHAIFVVSPLMVVALSGPILGEKVGWRRWAAVAVGGVGILIVLRPGAQVLSPLVLLPLIGAFMFAIYGLLTRLVSRDDPAEVSFFYTGISGAVAITLVGVFFVEPMARSDWPYMAALCCTAVLGHWMLIRAYELAEASSLQPFAYTQLVWICVIGFFVFRETVTWNVIVGAMIIVGAGLFSWWRARVRERQLQRAA